MSYEGLAGIGFLYPSADTPVSAFAGLNEITSSFVIEKAVEETPVTGWRPGSGADDCQQSVVRTISPSAEWQMTVTFQELTWELLQHIFQEFAANSTAYDTRKSFSFRVPATAPYEVESPFITTFATPETTAVGYTERGAWGERGPILPQVAAPTAADSRAVQLDATNGKLIFDAAAAGAPGVCQVAFQHTNIETLLVEANPLAFATMDFSGAICTDDYATANGIGIRAYEMQPSQNITINFEADAPAPEIIYNLRTPSGKRSPLEFYKIN